MAARNPRLTTVLLLTGIVISIGVSVAIGYLLESQLVVWIIRGTAGILVLSFLIALGYRYEWTGFGRAPLPKSKDKKELRPEKTVWDWMDLLIVPLVLGVGAILLTAMQQNAQQRALEEQQNAQQRALEEQRAQDAGLEAYLDVMRGLLLNKDLRSAGTNSSVRTIANAETSFALQRLDSRRQRQVLLVLTDSHLIDANDPVIDLNGESLSEVDLSGMDFSGTDLSGVDLSGANLSGANLEEADLSCAPSVDPLQTRSEGCTDLSGANLRDANLKDADLRCAEARVWWNEGKMERTGCVDLRGAVLSGANLKDAKLGGADLSGAKGITNEQIKARTSSLEGATMPNGHQIMLGLPEKKPRSSHPVEIEPGKYTTEEFKPAFVFEVGKGWKVPSSETLQELSIDGSPGPGGAEAHPPQLRFISTGLVFDPSNPSELDPVSAPDNEDEWVSWFQSHSNLETSRPHQVSVGSEIGVQLDVTHVTFTSKPGKYPQDCDQPCVPLFPSCIYPYCSYGYPYSLPSIYRNKDREIVSYADSKGYPKWKDRFIFVDVGGETVVVDVKAPEDKFDEFLSKAQKLLDTIEWKGE